MNGPEWLSAVMVMAIHDEHLAIHGGLPGLREVALLESAPDRPGNTWTCVQAG
jgi:death-on-curing protein